MNSITRRVLTASAILICSYGHSAFAAFNTLAQFGDNPGQLSASYYTPAQDHKPLVVLLHGCSQNGQELAEKSGLLSLAKNRFAVLVVQQSGQNNIKSCFNWYSDDDYNKDGGESLSIKNMIVTLKQRLKSTDTYIMGLSAGGAMTSVMMVNYPELFRAGAVIAGIPFPCADGLIKAISCMKNGPSQTIQELTALVKSRNQSTQQWPQLSVWTGTADKIVNPSNAKALALAWVALRKLSGKAEITQRAEFTISVWRNQQQPLVELVELNDLGHGIMVDTPVTPGEDMGGFLLNASISTVKHITQFWRLTKGNNQNTSF